MNEPLERLLQDLAREQAGEDFAERVWALRSQRSHLRALRLRVMAVCCVLFLATGGGLLHYRTQKKQRLLELRAEHARIERELTALKNLTEDYSSFVYLGNTGQEEVMLDLGNANSASQTNQTVSIEF